VVIVDVDEQRALLAGLSHEIAECGQRLRDGGAERIGILVLAAVEHVGHHERDALGPVAASGF
jgi:hypothetical protein